MNTATKISSTIASTTFFVLGITNSAAAVIVIFNSSDVGDRLRQPGENITAAAEFDVAASAIGTTNLINFETVNLGIFDTLSIVSGVTVTLINNERGGIRSDQNITYGYNTTVGGSQFLQFRPIFDTTASLNFDFAEPIQGFGAYITGLGTAAGNLNVIFNNGTNQQLVVTGNPFGGAQFWGFIDSGKLISNISLTLSGVTSLSRDIFGVDDVRYISTCMMQKLQ